MTIRLSFRSARAVIRRTRPLTRLRGAMAFTLLTLAAGCKDFLDVNDNPNGPETASANLYLAPMLHWMVTGPQFDARFIGRYTQEWYLPGTVVSTWDRQGYDAGSDNAGQLWRDIYWSFGLNLVDMTNKAEAEQRWDLLGVAQILKAWGWHQLAGLHGEIIVREAINPTQFAYNYDSQEYAYLETRRLLYAAIANLSRTDGAVNATYLGRTDKIYNGDRQKWLRFANGLLAMHYNHFSNKSSYNADSVIAAVDRSFASNADDALLTYPNTNNDDINFFGRTRNNLTNYRPTQFVVNILNGTVFTGAVDPRMARMISPAPDGVFRGLDINVVGNGALTATQQPNNFFGYPGAGGLQLPGKFLFDDKARMPAMTYAQLQFVKAEAAFRKNDRALALAAYTAGINAHFDFVNARNLDNNQAATQITAAERTAYLANANVLPTSPAGLTLWRIMTQKYIAQWGWGHLEMWMDLRRYNYTGLDPAGGQQVFPTFALPTSLFPDNGGRPVQRIRPRFNSEYVWNRPGLDAIGGLATDYHTKPVWITQP
jgi:hypothetical protein